jgi:hypothetical protein
VSIQPVIIPVKQHAGDTCIMPLSYLPPVEFYQIMLKYKNIIFDIHEHFHKQFYFNRCVIYGANGALKLSVPVVKNHVRTPLKNVSIFYGQNWRIIHWRSIEAAYRRSPFFEFYEDSFRNIYLGAETEKLADWNLDLFKMINKLMGIELSFSFTESYEKAYENIDDYRNLCIPGATIVPPLKEINYQQVFQEKYGFIKNLSIIDLLFSEGQYARQMLLE